MASHLSFDELAALASPQSAALARRLLEQDYADRRWAQRLGPACTQADVAELLGISQQAVSKSRRLLRIVQRDGRPVYPLFQFDGRRQLPGVGDVVALLGPLLEPLTVASWLTGPLRELDGRRPLDVLADVDGADRVLVAAKHLAAAAAA